MDTAKKNQNLKIKFYTNKYSMYETEKLGEYFCKIHNSKLKTIDILKRHLKEKHSENNYQTCEFCYKKVKRLYQHYKHCSFKNLIRSKNEKIIINSTIIYNDGNSSAIESKENNIIIAHNKTFLFLKDIFKQAPNNIDELYDLIDKKYKLKFLKQINKYSIIGSDILGKGTYGICSLLWIKIQKNLA